MSKSIDRKTVALAGTWLHAWKALKSLSYNQWLDVSSRWTGNKDMIRYDTMNYINVRPKADE